MVRFLALKLIRLYQKTLSPDYGWFKVFYPVGYCKFSPTCSMYTYASIERFGVVKGSYLGFKRIIRCNPWSRGGLDNIPK